MEGAPVLLIDNVDSFTYNIADLLHRVLGAAPTVWRNDHRASAADLSRFAAIVVGPGPGRPQHAADLGLSELALRLEGVPVLGVCLGHQAMAHLAGDGVRELVAPMHGRVSAVEHDGTGLFVGVPSPFAVVRYHSLEVRPAPSSALTITARATDDGCVMALADPERRWWGVQFHPESVLSEHGERIVANFFALAGVPVAGGDPTGRDAGTGTEPGAAATGGVAVGDVLQAHRASGPRRAVRLRSRSMAATLDSARLQARLSGWSRTSWWLDSSAGSRDGAEAVAAARCSMFGDGDGPLSHLLTHRVGEGSSVDEPSGTQRRSGPLLDTLADLMGGWAVEEVEPPPCSWRPGYVGYLGYELKAETDGSAAHRAHGPDAWLVFADRGVVVDHVAGRVHAVWLEDDASAAAQAEWAGRVASLVADEARRCAGNPTTAGPAADSDTADGRPATAVPDDEQVSRLLRVPPERYLDLIDRCREQIAAGESYEICLTNQVAWPGVVDESQLARVLRRTSPVPFGAWLRGDGISVVGASPERFVRVDADGTVEARPIKGTRPRDPDPGVDAALAADLAVAVKDRAENLMIVDLLRNDLHRVCRTGSVQVPQLFAVESYATVHQLVSTVRGRLAEGMGALDVIEACFPGGSMTGAPKVRTMEILDHLEGSARGVYSGAIGWLGLDGAMDLSIVIRTATSAHGRVSFGVGGAITALSDPAEELAETLHKARGMARALAEVDAVEVTVADVHDLLDLVDELGGEAVVDGGWAFDAHAGRQTRRHRDLDLLMTWADGTALVDRLVDLGWVPLARGGNGPWNVVLVDPAGRSVDLHLLTVVGAQARYGAQGAEHATFPAASLRGSGSIGGRSVRVVTPDQLRAFKEGYRDRWDDDDRHDLALLLGPASR